MEPHSDRGTREQLRWIGLLWMAGFVMDFTAAGQRFWLVWVLVIGLPVLLRPASAWAFGLLLAGTAVAAVANLPALPNHLLVGLLAALGFGVSALWVWATRNRPDARGDFLARWFDTARTPVGLTLLLVYLFAAFHKLNTAYFDPAVSCAGAVLGHPIITIQPDLRVPTALVQIGAVGSVVVEFGIPVLLAIPRLRRWGLLLGIAFHLSLAPGGFWDFATLVFALYLLLMPRRVFTEMAGGTTRLRVIVMAGFGVNLALFVTAVALPVPMLGVWGRSRLIELAIVAWFVGVLPLLVRLIRGCFAERRAWAPLHLRPAVVLVVPLLAFVNGWTPYLGLKTVPTFSMFSNLHVEAGATNHLLPGMANLQVAPFLADPVTVTALELRTDDRREALRKLEWAAEQPPITVPWLELRRAVAQWRAVGVSGARLEFEHAGVRRSVQDALTDPELSTPPPWWERHLLAFRAMDSGEGRDLCRW